MSDFEHLGPPDIACGLLHIWVHSGQVAASQDRWDYNWLHVTALCDSGFAQVSVSGSILCTDELAAWRDSAEKLHSSLTGKAELPTTEPNLSAEIALQDGRGEMRVSITADHMKERHEFVTDIDQSYLPYLIRSIDAILSEYPVRGHR